MKKLISLALCLIFVLSFVGCKKNEQKETRPTQQTDAKGADIVKNAKSGIIPEVKFRLGDDIETIKTEYEEKEDEIEGELSVIENGEYTILATPDNVNLVYETEKEEDGIKYIVYFGKAYGFEDDMDPNTVSEVMKSEKYEATLEAIPEELGSIIPGGKGMDCLSYTISDYSLSFVFEDNYLAATVIYKK